MGLDDLPEPVPAPKVGLLTYSMPSMYERGRPRQVRRAFDGPTVVTKVGNSMTVHLAIVRDSFPRAVEWVIELRGQSGKMAIDLPEHLTLDFSVTREGLSLTEFADLRCAFCGATDAQPSASPPIVFYDFVIVWACEACKLRLVVCATRALKELSP